MAKGFWLRRNDAFQATGLSLYQLDKLLQHVPRKMVGKHKVFFIDEDDLTEQFKDKNILQEEQNDQILDQLAGAVDFTDNNQLQSINIDLKKARKQQILVQTKAEREKLGQRKRELYIDWSKRFFECFSNHFGKLKNVIIELHLNEEQVNKFNETLDKCLNNMQISLNQIWEEFNAEKEQEII